ncbi:UDP-4-amino-4,6-dideoxy-N-acetyl-beta-L-altrosamine transaminase [Sandaracinus amylolyticus]|uniref:Bacillosamine/Legionaminic acid biosynthesis aminotransferase PglE n=1 Tax=Sandaracinus amylolyticus TaxID=927083 RepID=A0A0F6YIP9_9BACT|nr:UDP-4-amino-4,6-dideoxy-N-acetyl-beta-L-altrosamine transaminase [Sandaracinus amylolyticus]AKF06991.1 Bacillosamine/Legionaminic acid biosynthesis aminotransferase PglE [Sandaracinus amylolyticus]
MSQRLLPYGRQLIDDDDVAAVVETLRGDWLTQGPTVARFEEAVAELAGARYAVAVASGTAALHLACLAAGVRAGVGGVTSDITFVASANAIRYAGGPPRLADVDPDTALVRVDSMRAAADDLARAGHPARVLIPVDFSGTVADLPGVRALADELGAIVIEDAAHSLGASYEHGGRVHRAGSGSHAHMAIFSFHPVKHVTTCEGGAIVTNDEGAYRELLELRTHGITKDPARLTRNEGPWYYEQRTLGYHYRITDVQCALGLSQMRKAARFVERRRELAARYDRALAPLADRIVPLRVRAGATSSYHLYVARLVARDGETLESVAARRLALYSALREAAILPQVHYIPVHRQPDFVANGLSGGSFDGAERYYAGCLSLPLFPAMEDADVDRVADVIAAALAR